MNQYFIYISQSFFYILKYVKIGATFPKKNVILHFEKKGESAKNFPVNHKNMDIKYDNNAFIQ